MSEIKLLPCPFCGGEAKICGYYFIQCTKCGTSTLTHTNREEAIKTWNTRKPMQEIVERLRKLDLDGLKMIEDDKNELIRKKEAMDIVKEVGGMNE